jgi:hypothetical protein
MVSMKLFVCALLCALASAADNKPVISLDLSTINSSPVQLNSVNNEQVGRKKSLSYNN